MLRCDNVNRKLQIILAGVITTSHLPVMVSYSDKTATTYNGASQLANSNSTTAVDICAAPAASTIRDVDYISVRNSDTVAATVTIRYNDNATLYTIVTATLAVGDQLVYTHGNGWSVIDSTGQTKATSATLSLTAANITNVAAGGIAATNVQTALNELDTEKANIASPTFTGAVVLPTPFTLGAVSVTATGTELNYVAGVTSAIQTQMNLKAPLASPTFTGTVVLPSTTSIATVSATEISYLDGVTSAIQTQIDTKAPIASPTFTGVVALQAGAAATPSLIPTGDTNTGMWFPAADTIAWSTGGTERLRVDSSGQVGVGVTPFANSLTKSLDLVQGGGLFGYANFLYLTANAYYNAGWLYKATDFANSINSDTTGWVFSTAPSGTAGAAVTFTQRLSIANTGLITVSTGGVLALQAGAAATPSLIATGDANTGMWFPAADTIALSTAGVERLRITATGGIQLPYTNTATIGAVTINLPAGRVNIAAAGTSVVVTNSLVTAASHVFAVVSTNDATARVTAVVPAAGSFTIYTVATTAQTSFDFLVINAD